MKTYLTVVSLWNTSWGKGSKMGDRSCFQTNRKGNKILGPGRRKAVRRLPALGVIGGVGCCWWWWWPYWLWHVQWQWPVICEEVDVSKGSFPLWAGWFRFVRWLCFRLEFGWLAWVLHVRSSLGWVKLWLWLMSIDWLLSLGYSRHCYCWNSWLCSLRIFFR